MLRRDDEPVDPGSRQTRQDHALLERVCLIGISVADFIRASGHEYRNDRPDTWLQLDHVASPFACTAGAVHTWSYDFVEDSTHNGRKFRMLNVIDEFTRECLAIRIDRRLRSTDVIDVLSDLFIMRGVPGHVRSDNVLCREAALGFGQQVSSRRQIADVGSKLIQMVSTVNGIAPSHSKHRIQRH